MPLNRETEINQDQMVFQFIKVLFLFIWKINQLNTTTFIFKSCFVIIFQFIKKIRLITFTKIICVWHVPLTLVYEILGKKILKYDIHWLFRICSS